MFNKFQTLVNNILESFNMASAGGSLGTPEQAIYNPPDKIESSDSYQQSDARNIFGGVFYKKGKKGKKNKKTPLVIQRNLPKKDL